MVPHSSRRPTGKPEEKPPRAIHDQRFTQMVQLLLRNDTLQPYSVHVHTCCFEKQNLLVTHNVAQQNLACSLVAKDKEQIRRPTDSKVARVCFPCPDLFHAMRPWRPRM